MAEVVIIEDNELEEFHNAVCNMQIVYNAVHTPDGTIDVTKFYELSKNKKVFIIVDNNLMQYIIKIFQHDSRYEDYKQIIAIFMYWTKMMNIQLTCGFSLFEIGKDNADEYRNLFLQACNKVKSLEWRALAYGSLGELITKEVPSILEDTWEYDYSKNEHFLMHYIEMVKLVQLICDTKTTILDKFKLFIKWYYEHLIICSSTISYVAMCLTNNGVKPPKNINSPNIDKVLTGCKNQAWDLTFLSLYSTLLKGEDIYFIATFDSDMKNIFINSNPPGEEMNLITTIFSTDKEIEQIKTTFQEAQTGIRKYKKLKTKEEKIEYLEKLLEKEIQILEQMR